MLRQFAEAHSQQDPTFSSTIAYTRLTAAANGEFDTILALGIEK